MLCLLFVLCFVSSSQAPHWGSMQGLHSAARSCSAPWEWVLCVLLAVCKCCLSPILHLVSMPECLLRVWLSRGPCVTALRHSWESGILSLCFTGTVIPRRVISKLTLCCRVSSEMTSADFMQHPMQGCWPRHHGPWPLEWPFSTNPS